MKRVLTGHELTVTMGGQVFFQATIAGDTVRFCFGPANGPRATDFPTAAGDGRTLSTWVRARQQR